LLREPTGNVPKEKRRSTAEGRKRNNQQGNNGRTGNTHREGEREREAQTGKRGQDEGGELEAGNRHGGEKCHFFA
jgi:hypothetical protein